MANLDQRIYQLLKEGFDELKNKNNEEAIIKFRSAAFLDKNNRCLTGKYLAYAYMTDQKLEEAIQNYKYYLEYNPTDIEAQNNLANCYFETKQFETAKKIYETILKNDPKQKESKFGLGNIYSELKQYDKAIEHYLSAINDGITTPLSDGWTALFRKEKILNRKTQILARNLERIRIIRSYLGIENTYLSENKNTKANKIRMKMNCFRIKSAIKEFAYKLMP